MRNAKRNFICHVSTFLPLSDKHHYECVCCSGVTDVADVFIQKYIILDADVLKKETVLFETACSNLQARYVKVDCIHKKLLNSAWQK